MMGKILFGLMLLCSSSVMADGIDQSREASVKAFLRGIDADSRDPNARYVASFADLNGDGKQEAIVQIISDEWCGSGGCSTWVLVQQEGRWKEQSSISIVHGDVRLLPHVSHGWHDLSVFVAGGGLTPGYAVLAFDGRRYPLNPSVPPARKARPGEAEAGRLLLSASYANASPLYGD